MNEADAVGFAQRLTHLPKQVNGPLGRHGTILLDQLLQVHSRQVFHDVIKRPVFRVAVVKDLDCVPMGQGRRRLHFAFKANQGPGIAGLVGADELDGARPAQEDMFGQVDRPHAAEAQNLFEPILTDALGLVCLFLQLTDLVRAEHGDRRGGGHQNDRLGKGREHVGRRGPVQQAASDHQGNRKQCQTTHDRGTAPPGVGDERAVEGNQ